MQAIEPKEDKNWTTCTGAFVSRGADYVYAQCVQRLQLVLISRTTDINLPRNMRLKPVTLLKDTEKRATKTCTCFATLLQNDLRIAMLDVLPPTFKPVNNLTCCNTGLMWVVKRATLLFNSFCSNVATQVARFLLPVFPYLKHIVRVFTENDNWYLEFECDWLLNKIHLARDRAAVVTDRAAFV